MILYKYTMGCCQSREKVYYVVLQHERFIGITSDFSEAEEIFMAQKGMPDLELLELTTKGKHGGIIIKRPVVHYHTHGFI